MTSPPYDSMIIRRSWLTPSGITATKPKPELAHGQGHRDTRRAAGGLDDRSPRSDLAAPQGLAEDISRDSVLGRAAGIEKLELAPDRRAGVVQPDRNERRRRRPVVVSIELGKSDRCGHKKGPQEFKLLVLILILLLILIIFLILLLILIVL